jgi:hypothetical protein
VLPNSLCELKYACRDAGSGPAISTSVTERHARYQCKPHHRFENFIRHPCQDGASDSGGKGALVELNWVHPVHCGDRPFTTPSYTLLQALQSPLEACGTPTYRDSCSTYWLHRLAASCCNCLTTLTLEKRRQARSSPLVALVSKAQYTAKGLLCKSLQES